MLIANRWSRPERIDFIPNGIPPSPYQRPRNEAAARKGIVLGCVANFRPQKDHATLLRSFQLVAQECADCRLVLVGDGPCRAEAFALARDLGLGERVEFRGYVDDPRAAYGEFDVAVLASHYEGQSVAVLEAMDAGIPVVATRVGGTPDTISEGVEGLLVPEEDAPSMARAILRLAQDKGLRAAMGAAGRTRVAREFTAEAWVERLLGLYRTILIHPDVPSTEEETAGARFGAS